MSDVKAIFDDRIAKRVNENPDEAKKVGAIYKFNITGDDGGTWVVDLKNDPPSVKEGDGEAECTITMSGSDSVDLVNGKLNGQMAFMSGKLKIQGNMQLAMKLQQVIG